MAIVVLPEGEEDQPALVLLDRILRFSRGVDPGMPAAPGVAGGRVLVPEVALPGDDPGAELEEPPGDVDITGLIHGVDRQRGIPAAPQRQRNTGGTGGCGAGWGA